LRIVTVAVRATPWSRWHRPMSLAWSFNLH